MEEQKRKFEVPYDDNTFHVFGIGGLDIDEFWDRCYHHYDFKECPGDIVTQVFDSDDEVQQYRLYWKGASTQGVYVTFFPGEKAHMHIELPWLGGVGDVRLAFAFMETLKEMYPECIILIDDDRSGTFAVSQDNADAMLYQRLENMKYLITFPEEGEHGAADGVMRRFIVPSKWDYPETDITELAIDAMMMFTNLQWNYDDCEDDGEGEEETV